MATLPQVQTEEAFADVCRDEAALRPGVERLGRRLGLDGTGLSRFEAGSRPVYAAGDLVLKLFPPLPDWPDYRIEAAVLAAVDSRLPVPVPRVHAAGNHDGWGYVLMSRLPGMPLDTVWDRLRASDRDRLAGQLGELIAALHGLPVPGIAGWEPADWPAFVARQYASCAGQQRAWGLPGAWADQIPGFLGAVALRPGRPLLLHTEIMRQHLLAAQGQDGAWRLTGLIDFEPAMRGDREYEFVAVGVCSWRRVTPGSWPGR